MPVYTPHTLVAFGGSINGLTGKDSWQVGIRGGSFNNPSQSFGNSDAFIAALYPDLSTWFTTLATAIAKDVTLDWLKINDIGADGKYKELTTHRHDYAPVVNSPATAYAAPAYMSLAYTWETGLKRGLAHRGRVFVPNGAMGVSKGSECSSTSASQAANSGELLLSKIVNASDVATTGSDKFNPCVYSAKNGSYNRITAVSCDTLWDEQHRRKEQTAPTRVSVNVDYSTH